MNDVQSARAFPIDNMFAVPLYGGCGAVVILHSSFNIDPAETKTISRSKSKNCKPAEEGFA